MPRNATALPKFAATAAGLRARKHPTTLIINSESNFALVKKFWISLPRFSPRRLLQVSSAITAIASSRSPDSPTPPIPIHRSGLMIGKMTPLKRAKATATAATVPVCTMSNSVHPNRNATSPP